MGVALAALLVAVGWYRRRRHKRALPGLRAETLLAVSLAALALVVAGGYVGGRMVYVQGVGGGSAPPLAGGISIDSFRQTHGRGLFPRSVVGDRMMAAVNAWLKTLPYVPHGDG